VSDGPIDHANTIKFHARGNRLLRFDRTRRRSRGRAGRTRAAEFPRQSRPDAAFDYLRARHRAIARAARKVIDGDLNEQLPLVVRQTHTQTYLNLNGVIGNRANALLGGELSSKARFSRTIVSTSGGRRTNRFRPRSMSRPSGTSCTTSLRRANFTARHVARKTRSPRSVRSATPVPIAPRGSSVALNG
jgi:hypothetical protein